MTLGEIARVTRGVVTGNKALFIMSRTEAAERGLGAFVRPLMGGVASFPKDGKPVVRDSPDRKVILIASSHDLLSHEALRAYLGDVKPRLTNIRPAPIAVTYVGIPRFVANPDGLVVTNSLYTLTPRSNLSFKEVLALVERLNTATSTWKKPRYAHRYTPRELESIDF